jgi:putative aldouronate transport system substrate-binding protein
MNGFKEALKVMRQWYKDGVIYPEFLTQSAETGNALLMEDRLGTIFSSVPHLVVDGPAGYTARNVFEKNPKAVFGVGINGLKGPDGKNFTYTWGNDLGWTMHFSYKASDEKIAKIMQINDFYLEGEGWLLQQFGKEGVSFDYVNGMPVSRLSATEQGKQGIGNLVINNPTAAAMELLYKGTQYFDVTVASLRLEMSQNAIGRMPLTESNNAGIGGDIQQIINKYAADVVTGAVDIDATWNSYLADLDRAGLAMQTVEAQKIYDTYFK